MGLLKVGTPLHWDDMLEHCSYIRRHGVLQFLATYRRMQHLENDPFFYGDELEYSLLKLDSSNKSVRLSLRGPEVMERLRKQEQENAAEGLGCAWHQEYGSWMLEGTPKLPYDGYASSLCQVEQNMRLRRGRLLSALAPDEAAPTLVAFPLMGVGTFTSPGAAVGGEASQSQLVPDACINPHPRFGTLTANIRRRRGAPVAIQVPLFRDQRTPASEKTIDMDCMAFGMGCCCLQVTFQAKNMNESRYLYDQLAVLAPIMMAMTAATPVLKGRLAATDARWNVISQSVDDRTAAERGDGHAGDARMAGEGVRRQNKSRYDSISCYIHPTSQSHNDIHCETDEEVRAMLRQEGLDEAICQHISHLFTRDPLVAFEGMIELDDESSTDHFESVQSTNWQTLRWKPPPNSRPDAPHIGWRKEFRSMEIQLTDFENAAFTAFMVLISRAILVFHLDILAPLSKVDENMRRAHEVDATRTQKFWFRTQVEPETRYEMCEMSMDEIMNGSLRSDFPGLIPLCYAYLNYIHCDEASFSRLDQYLKLIKRRASGDLLTPASWMRGFLRSHPDYKFDSVVSEGMAYDLVEACNEIAHGHRACPELLGEVEIEPITRQGQYEIPLFGEKLSSTERRKLLEKLWPRSGSCPCAPNDCTCVGAASAGCSVPRCGRRCWGPYGAPQLAACS